MEKLGRNATFLLLRIQEQTECDLKYNMSNLSTITEKTNETNRVALEELHNKGYIELIDKHNLRIIDKLKFPKFMNTDLDNNTKEQLCLIYNHIDRIDDITDYSEVATVIKKNSDDKKKPASNTIEKMYRHMRKLGIPIDIKLFIEDEYNCLKLTTLVPERKKMTTEEICIELDSIGETQRSNYSELVDIIKKQSVIIDELWKSNKETIKSLNLIKQVIVNSNDQNPSVQDLINTIKRSMK